jgi:opacity protein-like surface antigen
MNRFLILLAFPLAATADPLAFGVKGGVPMTDLFKIIDSGTYSADRQPYTLGPMVEVHLPFRISVEFDALYKTFEYRARLEQSEVVTTGNSWEFPVLLKYRFYDGPVKPYIGAGLAWKRFGGFKRALLGGGSPGTDDPPELRDSSGGGAVLAGGLELKFLFVRVSPEIRYTRWGSTNFVDVAKMASRVNQAEFLVGITF